MHPGHVAKGISSAAGTFTDFVSMDDLFRRLKEASRPVVLSFSEPEVSFSVSDKLPESTVGRLKVAKKTFLSSIVTDDKVLKWIVSKDKKGGMERMIYRSQVFQKRLGAFPEQEKLILAAFIAHSPSWKDIQEHFLGNAFPDGREEEVSKIYETIAAQVRIFRGWLRSQKL